MALTVYGQRYRDWRAAGLCGSCGKVKTDASRCPRCASVLSRRRYYTEDSTLGGRGTWGQSPATLPDIAAALGVSKEYARQLQERAIAKVAKALRVDRETALLGLAALGCMDGERPLPSESSIKVGPHPSQLKLWEAA